MLHGASAALGFGARFDRAVRELASQGRGAAISPGQARAVLRSGLDLRINPQRVSHRLADAWDDDGDVRSADQRFLDGGDWSDITYPIRESRAHVEMLDICRWRSDFRRTSRYRVLSEQIAAGESVRRYGVTLTSVADLDRHYLRGLSLVESIERQGLLTAREVRSSPQRYGLSRAPWRDWAERDIGVAVSADGSLIRHTCGRHRFAAAQGLALPEIAVEVRLVHAGWLSETADRVSLPPHQALPVVLSQIEADYRR